MLVLSSMEPDAARRKKDRSKPDQVFRQSLAHSTTFLPAYTFLFGGQGIVGILTVMIKKALEFYTRYFGIWVVVFGVIAFVWKDTPEHPNWFRVMGKYSLIACVPEAWTIGLTEKTMRALTKMLSLNTMFFGLTMFGIGVALELEDFKRTLKQPVAVLIGSAAQFTIMPIGAFVLAKLFDLSPTLTIGLVLTGAAPGAMARRLTAPGPEVWPAWWGAGGGGSARARIARASSRSSSASIKLGRH